MANVYDKVATLDTRQSDRVDHPVSRFRPTYRALTDEEKALHDQIKQQAVVLESLYEGIPLALGRGRYRALAMTALEESVMWIVKELTS